MLQQRQGAVRLVFEDDGRGFDVDEALRRGPLGLLGMRERAEMLGGTLDIESSPGHGATIYATVPALARQAPSGPSQSQQPDGAYPALA